jgi:hypothetical protein
MTEPRCPQCSEPVQAGFRVCPYCAAPLAAGPPSLPVVVPAERDGRRDLGRVGVGLIVLGLLGFVGVILTIGNGTRFDPEGILVIGGGTILMVVAGTAMAAGKRGGVATGILGGCASALMAMVLGGVLVLAMILYAVSDCLKTCNGQQSSQQRR